MSLIEPLRRREIGVVERASSSLWNLVACAVFAVLGGTVATLAPAADAPSAPASPDPEAARRGYRNLLDNPYVPSAFSEADFAEVWRVWPEPLRSRAERATPAERRKLAFERYGLTPRPGEDSDKPLQYVVTPDGRWTMNCLACHTGALDGQVVPGLPNANYAMQTLVEEIRESKLLVERPLTKADFASVLMPMGGNVGTTNAVMFGVVLMAYRDPDLNVLANRLPPRLTHHDMEAPPWWHFHRKRQLYIDGFAEKGHRGLMQFALDRSNGPEKFRQWEAEFRDVKAYLSSLRPPKFPGPVDAERAARGSVVFRKACAECHGTYGPEGDYPERTVAIDDVGTDRVRFDALSAEQRASYGASWFAEYGGQNTIAKPEGYVAPPLDGIWASGPYLHNGSVPTLWHLLRPSERPVVWRRSGEAYDRERMGLRFEAVSDVPAELSAAERRTYFDTRRFGKSARGHDYPEPLSEPEKVDLLEYLKTL